MVGGKNERVPRSIHVTPDIRGRRLTADLGASEWQAMPLKSRDKIELQKVDAFFELRREEFLKGLEEPRLVSPAP